MSTQNAHLNLPVTPTATPTQSPVAAQFLMLNLTKRQAVRRLRLLKDYFNYRYFNLTPNTTEADSFAQFSKQISQTHSRAGLEDDLKFITSLPQDFWQQFNATNLKAQLDALEQAVNNANTVVIYLPFDIPEPELVKLGQYFKSNLGPRMLIEIQFDPSLIGGCALSYGGVYRDFSIKRKIEERKKEILSSLLSYRRK